MTRELLLALWQAANDHSTAMLGEWIPEDYEGQDTPPPPSDEDIIKAVTAYLRATI